MTTPISSSSTTPPPAPPGASVPPAPIGIGSNSGSLSSAEPSPPDTSSHWEKIKKYASSFAEFVRDLISRAIEGIRSRVASAMEWLGKTTSPTEEAPDDWEIPPFSVVPVPQPAVPTTPAAPDPFSLLPISDTDRKKIHTLIHAMGSWSWLKLLAKKTKIEEIGQEINPVHPLKFLDYIFRHPTLTKNMESIAGSSPVWNPFVSGVTEKMRREAATLPACKAGFAKSLNINLADIEPYFATSRWEDLVSFLIAVKTGGKKSVWVEPQAPAPTLGPGTASTAGAPPPVSIAATQSHEATSSATSSTAASLPSSSATTQAVQLPGGPSSAAAMTPPPAQSPFDSLPFAQEDHTALSALIASYAEHNVLWRGTHSTTLGHHWTRLRACHPLKLLAELYSNRSTIGEGRINHRSFLGALKNEQLSRMPIDQVLPHVEAFATHCHLDQGRVQTLIQGGNWKKLVKELIQSHRLN